MSAEVHLAFAHPEARAAATIAAHEGPLDRISLRDYTVDVEIGAFQAERGTTQKICFNIAVEVRPIEGPIDDDVDKILSYDRITWAIHHELAAERLNLLETLAERVAERILMEPQAERVFVRIEKLDRGPGALGVEIVRERIATPIATVTEIEEDMPHPRVVFLSNDAIQRSDLASIIDDLEAVGAPLIFCVGLPETALPASSYGPTDRRIELLAIEQNAWVLAARDVRCVVVGTRTEIDWAMKNNQICVWAPSKIVLDAVDRPDVPPSDGVGLSLWFATEMVAAELITIGARAPNADLATREIRL